MVWDTKRVILAGAVLVAFTQIGNGLKALSWLINVPETAYAAKATADETRQRFDKFIDKMDAYTEAMNQANAPQSPMSKAFVEIDERKRCWSCDSPDGRYETCWQMELWQPCEATPMRK